jgi:hypothetical protein
MTIACALLTRLGLGAAIWAGAAGVALAPAAQARTGASTAALGQRARIADVLVTPTRIVEDSRCPAGVQCIQAGTVRVSAFIVDRRARQEAELALGRPLRLASGRWLTLAAVCPPPRPPSARSRPAYRLTFTLGSSASGAPLRSGCGR